VVTKAVPGNEFDVTISTTGAGVVIKDTLRGAYKSSSLKAYQVCVSGNVVTFTLAGYQSFTHTVEAPDTPDACCTIEGGSKDINQGEISIQVTQIPESESLNATKQQVTTQLNPDDGWNRKLWCIHTAL